MNKLNKIITTLVITTMLSLPLFGAILRVKPADLATTNDVSWNSKGG